MSADVGRFLRLTLPVLVLAAVSPILALSFGGYHVRTSGWVVLGLALWAAVLVVRGRLSAPRSAAGVATFAMLALTLWTTASIAWVQVSTHDAWVEAVRTLGYTAAFILGTALLPTARAFTRFATLTGAGFGILALATTIRIHEGDAPLTNFTAGRLDWPVGYAPGLAAMYLIGALLLIGTSCAAERAWRSSGDSQRHSLLHLAVGGLSLGGAGACAALAILAQSRGTVPAIAVALVVAVVVWPGRLALVLRVVAVAGTMFAARGALAAAYQSQFALRQAPFTEGSDEPALLELARQAAQHAASMTLVCALVLTAVGAALVALGGAAAEQVHERSSGTRITARVPANVLAVGGVFVVVLVLALGGLHSHGSIGEQVHSCTHPVEQTHTPGPATSYFASTGTGRCDYYRVALLAARDHPLLGLGAGNFRGEYVLHRRTEEEPTVTHSLPLQLLAELGIVGALLGAAVLGSVLLAAWRFLHSGPARDPAFAGALAALAYWTAHASIDWLWQLPAVSLPALALAGGLVACVSPGQARLPTRITAPIATGAMLAIIALVLPVTMADRALRKARDPQLQATDRNAAINHARDAQSFDPGWAEPYITEGAIQAAAGNRAASAKAGRKAVDAEPDNWSVQYRASGMIGFDSTKDGQAAVATARELNPRLAQAAAADAATAAAPTDPDSLQNPDS